VSAARPLVTVCLPTYNGAALVRRALDALLAQDYPNIELLIADDVSSDDTPRICAEYAARHPHLRFRRNARNLGSWGNFAHLLPEARGEYVLWASQDDWWDPRFVSALVEAMDGHPDVVAALPAVQFRYVNDVQPAFISRFTGKSRPDRQSRRALLRSMFSKRGAAGEMNRTNMYIHGLVRTHSFQAAMAAYPGVILHERQIVCHWVLKGRFAYVDEVLCEKLSTGTSVAERHGAKTDFVVAREQAWMPVRYASALVRSILRSTDLPPRRKAWAALCAWYYLSAWARKQAERAVMKAVPEPLLRALGARRKTKSAG
jgi:glycosyltransferase involved in cell wall biosynthesis